MKIIISPAKSLDNHSKLPISKHTYPFFIEDAARLNTILKGKSPKQLAKLMGISDTLAELNWQRNQDFETPFTSHNARPAIYTYNGDVYAGLDAYTIPENNIDRLQHRVRILSGLYGILRPLDVIQPYRLEMKTKLSTGKNKNLYEFWSQKIAKKLSEEVQDNEHIINLASAEYFSVIDTSVLKAPIVTPKFVDFKNGQYKPIMFYVKKARGLMVRYIIDTDAQTIDDIKGFNYDGYRYSETHATEEQELVFIR